MGRRSGGASARDCALVRGMAERYGWVGGIEVQKRRTAWVPGELAESQLAEGNPLSRPKQSSEGGSDRSDDPTQLKPKGGRKKA